ncbi:MAG: 50S ribosomal protein L30 [Flavobacteriaceae bacterium]|nr:50S ribosomal protein L30 [Flavobacteriaceae bacterium]MCY4268240.1 50S ribosomal protein L30 [Flavobacteriaceae bacterium]MCY4300045.1 50S ribosomal protein L30 [Flavobacteriaceae bacterium]
MAQIEITQIRSSIKCLKNQKRTLQALGLRGISKKVVHDATPSILGMVKKVEHLVAIQTFQTKKK